MQKIGPKAGKNWLTLYKIGKISVNHVREEVK